MPVCAPTTRPGGDWPNVNGDLHNTRHQDAADDIDAGSVAGLQPAWSFDGRSVDATGGMRSTPIVAHGCVYMALGEGYLGDRGDVIALDADTGELVWHTTLAGSVLGLAAANGLVYTTPSMGTRGDVEFPVVTDDYQSVGTFVAALDAVTGEVAWTSERLDDGDPSNGIFVNASPVVFNVAGRSLLFVPLAGGSGDGARVPMYFLDALTGETVTKTYALSEADYQEGFGGAGIWSTAAYDPGTQHLYAGTADSDGHTRQHPYNNAILKIDANPLRTTFGSVVAAYSGTTEHADFDEVIGHPNNPACGLQGNQTFPPPTFTDTSASMACLEFDFDFGASPNLYVGNGGRLKVAALQKSGVFHVVDTDGMEADWTFTVGPGGAAMDGATAAVGDGSVFIAATPNLLFGLDDASGAVDWVGTSAVEVFDYQPLTLAGGVLYKINDSGFLVTVDAASGVPIMTRSIATDGEFDQCLGVGAGVAVAHGTVFAPCDAGGPNDLAGLPGSPGGIVAYRVAADS